MTKQTVVEVRLTHKVESYNNVRYLAIPSDYYSLPQNVKLTQFMPTMSIDTENTLYIEVYPESFTERHGLVKLKAGKAIDIKPLASLSKLLFLDITNNKVSKEDTTWLSYKLPDCRIYRVFY